MRIVLAITMMLLTHHLIAQSGIADMRMGADGFEAGSDSTYVHRIEFLDDKTFEELRADSSNYTVQEEQFYNYSILYFKLAYRADPTTHYAFYRIHDTKYKYTKTVKNTVVEEGYLKNAPTPSQVDTIIKLDLLDFKDKYTFVYYYPSQKTEAWFGPDQDARAAYGFYKNGLKHGYWELAAEAFGPAWRYDQGNIISYFNLDSLLAHKHSDLFIGQQYMTCSIQNNPSILEFVITPKNVYHCNTSQTLSINADHTFSSKGFEESSIINNGTGTWELNKKGHLILTFSDKVIFHYKIVALGENFLNLELPR